MTCLCPGLRLHNLSFCSLSLKGEIIFSTYFKWTYGHRKDEQVKQMGAMSAQRHAVLSTNRNSVLTELMGSDGLKRGQRAVRWGGL